MGEQKVLSFGIGFESRFAFRVSNCFFFFLWVLERDSFVSGGQVKTAHHAQLNLLINNYAVGSLVWQLKC